MPRIRFDVFQIREGSHRGEWMDGTPFRSPWSRGILHRAGISRHGFGARQYHQEVEDCLGTGHTLLCTGSFTAQEMIDLGVEIGSKARR